MMAVDAERPQAVNVRTKKPYQLGIGPHTERSTNQLVANHMLGAAPTRYCGTLSLEIPYPENPRSKCDVCLGTPPEWEWAIEIKMLRFMGDNGKPNDNILMHILSPYPRDRSAVTDCEKLIESSLPGRKGIVIFGYDYPDLVMDPAIEAFELVARQRVKAGQRYVGKVEGLVHPIHQEGRVFGWEITANR